MESQFIRIENFDEWEPPGMLARVLARLLPHANPDFESVFPRVRCWWLELRNGTPVREIGFSADGLPLVLGPFKDNRGFWTDSPVLLDAAGYAHVGAEEFERQWGEAAAGRQGRT
jgi:hypothetical protein